MLHVLHHPQVVPRGMEGNRYFFVHAMLLQCSRGINPEPVRDLSQFVLKLFGVYLTEFPPPTKLIQFAFL